MGRRRHSVTIPPIRGQAARTKRAKAKLLVRLRTTPIRYGPAKPPRLPIELIKASPAAAAVPVKNWDDIAQKGPRLPQMPTAANDNAATSAAGDLKRPASTSPIVPTNADPATCHRRSFR